MDNVLSERITVLKADLDETVGEIAEGTSVKEYVDVKVQGETDARMAMDTVHTNQLNNRYTKAEVDALLGDKIGSDYVDDRIGTLSIGTFSSDNVTDFVGDLLFKDATGDMGGLSVKVYVDNATTELNNDIDQIYDKDNGTGIVADLGTQINALTTRVTDLETAVGALENKFDGDGNLTGNIIGDLTGNTFGNHTGDVLDANGNVIVDVANANFNGNVLGNLTGNTVGNHYGNVYNDATDVLLVDASTGAFVGETLALSAAAGIGGTLEVDGLTHLKDDLIVDGAGAVGGGLQVGEQVLARSARLNDNPAGPQDGTTIPFMAVDDSDVVTRKFYMDHGPNQTNH